MCACYFNNVLHHSFLAQRKCLFLMVCSQIEQLLTKSHSASMMLPFIGLVGDDLYTSKGGAVGNIKVVDKVVSGVQYSRLSTSLVGLDNPSPRASTAMLTLR